MSDLMTRAQEAYSGFTESFRSVVLATVDAEGLPTASYAPFIQDERRRIVCFVSGLSAHTPNLQGNPVASALFVDDESASEQIFARRRLTYACEAEFLDKESDEARAASAAFIERFGGIAEQILSMPDFRPVRFTPTSGQFVIGFGAAFRIEGDDLDTLVHQKGGGQGHGHGGHGHGGHGHGGHGHGGHGHGGHGHGGHGHGGHGHGGHGHGGHWHGGHDGQGGQGGQAGQGAGDLGSDGSLPRQAEERIVGHMNGDHADSILLYARVHGRRTDATAARLEGLDAGGLDLRITTAAGEEALRVPFAEPLKNAADAHQVLVSMSVEARERSAAGAPGADA